MLREQIHANSVRSFQHTNVTELNFVTNKIVNIELFHGINTHTHTGQIK